MKKAVISCILVLPFFLIAGCSSERDGYKAPEFPVNERQEIDIISDDIEAYKHINDFFIYKDYFVVVNHDKDRGFVHLFSRDDFSLKATAVKNGRGPRELIVCSSCCLDEETGMLYLLDNESGIALKVSLDAMIAKTDDSPVENIKLPVKPTQPRSFYRTSRGWIFENKFSPKSNGKDSIPRLTYHPDDGSAVNEGDGWPAVSSLEKTVMFNMEHPSSFSADDSLFVIGTRYGAILEIFDLEAKPFHEKAIKYFYPSDLVQNSQDLNKSNMVLGFGDFQIANNIIYAVVDFKTKYKEIFSTKPPTPYTRIAEFDLSGNPIKLIETNTNIKQLVVEGKWGYLLIRDDKGITRIGKISL